MQNNHQKQSPAEGSKSSMFDLKTIITILIPALAVLIAGIIGGIDPDKLAALFAIATLLFTAIWEGWTRFYLVFRFSEPNWNLNGTRNSKIGT